MARLLTALISLCLITTTAFAGIPPSKWKEDGAAIGLVAPPNIDCQSNITCTKNGNTVEIDVSSGTSTDGSAIHVDVSGEIAGIAAKATPVAADYMVIEDSAASNAKKSITIADLEPAIESMIDTLANLTSVQGRTVTLADAGANAVLGWDDVAGAYENLTAAEVRGTLGQNAGTDITADLEEEVTAGSLANDVILEEDLKVVDAASDEDVLTRETTTGDFEWHSRDEVIAGTSAGALPNDSVLEADLKVVDSPSDEDIFTYESTTGDFEWHTIDQMIANMSAGGLPNDSVLEADLKAVDAASDEECLTYETTTGDFEWQTCGSGSDTNAVKEFWFPASALLPVEPADGIPPITKTANTNVDTLSVSYNDSADECRTAHIKVPSDVESGSTITFRWIWFSLTATSGNVVWDVRYQSTGAEGESIDGTTTIKAAASDAAQGTVKLRTVTTVTETLANLGWAANDDIALLSCRDGNGTNGTDDMTGDAELYGFSVEIPRA